MTTIRYQPDALRKLPPGIQSFEDLRREGYLYVAKTALVYQLMTPRNPYFLSRPRRFGKSLLLSTLEAYFKGEKEPFEELTIEQLPTKCKQHAELLHLNLNAEKYDNSLKRLKNSLEPQPKDWETLYGTALSDRSHSSRFKSVTQKAGEQTGHDVVVLIDKYDKPLLRSFHDEKLQDQFRSTLLAFYTVLKSADPCLKFIFITGATKFTQVRVFSELNQFKDISMHPHYATLRGLTRQEKEETFPPELNAMAASNHLPYGSLIEKLTQRYDGYRFIAQGKEGMHNPFSVLSALDAGQFRNFWFATVTPTFLGEMLKETRNINKWKKTTNPPINHEYTLA